MGLKLKTKVSSSIIILILTISILPSIYYSGALFKNVNQEYIPFTTIFIANNTPDIHEPDLYKPNSHDSNQSSLLQMEIFNPEDSNFEEFKAIHKNETNTILLVIKNENGTLFLENNETIKVINWARQNNLSIYGFIEILKDITYSQLYPERTQKELSSQETSNFISPLDEQYNNYLRSLIFESASYLDGIILSNLRYKSQFYDYSEEIKALYTAQFNNVNWSTIDLNLDSMNNPKICSSNECPIIQYIDQNPLEVMNYSEDIKSFMQSINLSNFIQTDKELKNNEFELILEKLNEFGVGNNSSCPVNISKTLDYFYEFIMQDNVTEMFKFEMSQRPSLDNNSYLTLRTWQLELITNYLLSLHNAAKSANKEVKIILTTYGSVSADSKYKYGQSLHELCRYINGTIGASELANLSSGNIVTATIDGDIPLWLAQLLSILASIGIGFGFLGALALCCYVFAPCCAAVPYILEYVFPLFMALVGFWEEDWAEAWADPPGLTPQQKVEEILYLWNVEHKISMEEAKKRILETIANDFTLSFKKVFPSLLYEAMDQTWTGPRYIIVCFIIFGIPICVRINIFKGIYDLYRGWISYLFDVTGFYSNLKSQMISEASPHMSDWLYTMAHWDFNVWGENPSKSAIITPPETTTIDYIINLQNTGNVVDNYSFDINLPMELQNSGATWELVEVIGGSIIDNNIQVDAGATAKLRVRLNLPPEVLPETYQFPAIVTSEHLSITKTVDLTLIVTSLYGVSVNINPQSQIVDAGQTIQYQIEIENIGSTSSIFNVELLGLDPSINYLLSKSSTNLLAQGDKEIIDLFITPPRCCDLHAGVYPFSVNAYLSSPELRPDISASDSADITINPFREVEVEFLPLEENSLEPGESITAFMVIHNTGNVWDNFTILMENYPEWYDLSTNYTELYPCEETIISVDIKPPRQCTIVPGITSHEIRAISQLDPSISNNDLLDLEILPFHEVKVNVEPNSTNINPGENANFTFTIQNVGNIIDNYYINFIPLDFQDNFLAYPTQVQEDWVLIDDPTIIYEEIGWYGLITLEPCQTETIELMITIPEDWAGFENTTYEMRLAAILENDLSIFDLISLNLTVSSNLNSMKQFVKWEIDQLNEAIQLSPEECWSAPVSNRKSAMNNKLIELKALISTNAFSDAYDKLIHDIKPKLTGLKTDENEIPWGNGIFNNPWITCNDLQEIFRLDCNKISTHIKNLFDI